MHDQDRHAKTVAIMRMQTHNENNIRRTPKRKHGNIKQNNRKKKNNVAAKAKIISRRAGESAILYPQGPRRP